MSDRSRQLKRWMTVAVAAVAGALAIGVGLVYVTGLPAVCGSCHEMSPHVATWRTSAHTNVGCPDCHEKPRPWYQFPQTLAARSAMFRRDVGAHISKGSDGTTPEITSKVSDETCLQCHDLSRQITLRYGTLIDHNEHAKRNGSCVSCHFWTAHPKARAEKPLLMMEQCFKCHGRTVQAKAPGSCKTCHPSSFSLSPESHNTDAWRSGHGKAYLKKSQPCSMCHEQQFCTACHGLEMPHPKGWAKGKSGHAVVANVDKQVCIQCHRESPDFCSMCHHKDFEPTKGPWVRQHPRMVSRRGASFCMSCHTPMFCVRCHTGGKLPEIAPVSGP